MSRVIGWGVSSWVDDGLSRPAFFTSPIKQKPPALANRGSAYRMKLALTACQSAPRSEEHTSELQSRPHLVCRLLLEKKKTNINTNTTHSQQETSRSATT